MTQKRYLMGALLVLTLSASGAGASTHRATISGGGSGGGKCTIEVNVDGAAEVDIWGDTGELRTISGQEAVWRRFQCTAPLPHAPLTSALSVSTAEVFPACCATRAPTTVKPSSASTTWKVAVKAIRST